MIHTTRGTYRRFSSHKTAADIVQWDYGSWPDGLPKKDGAHARSGAGSLDTATTCLSKTSRTKNFIIEIQILKKVAILRNSVAHKQLLNGMTTYASYNDKPIFDSDYVKKLFDHSGVPVSGVNEETVEQLLKEVDRAHTVLNQLRQEAALRQLP